jgi:hypothetical protein
MLAGMTSRLFLAGCGLAAVSTIACKGEAKRRGAVDPPTAAVGSGAAAGSAAQPGAGSAAGSGAGSAPVAGNAAGAGSAAVAGNAAGAGSAPVAGGAAQAGAGSAAPMPASVAGCTPIEPHQRAGRATITVVGDGLEVRDVIAPAICGAFHTEATKRFAVGDGTLFKACLPDGLTFSISSDVVLTGKQTVTFTYEDYKKKTALLEVSRVGVGTYNQRDEPTDKDQLFIGYDWHEANAHVDLVWPSNKDRVLRVDAVFDCGGPLR